MEIIKIKRKFNKNQTNPVVYSDPEINELKKKLKEEKGNNKKLSEENKKLNDIINILKLENKDNKANMQIEINKLKEKIKILEKELDNKNKEIQNYILQLQNFGENKNQINKNEDNNFSVTFMTKDSQDILNHSITCKKNDLFVRLEERLYNDYPKYKNYETFFVVNDKKIFRFKTLEENNIVNNDIISLNLNKD